MYHFFVVLTVVFWQVEVDLGGGGVKEEVQTEGKPTKAKVLPPWMIKEGMVLTKEQRGEASHEAEVTQEATIDDKKQADLKEDDKSLVVSTRSLTCGLFRTSNKKKRKNIWLKLQCYQIRLAGLILFSFRWTLV